MVLSHPSPAVPAGLVVRENLEDFFSSIVIGHLMPFVRPMTAKNHENLRMPPE